MRRTATLLALVFATACTAWGARASADDVAASARAVAAAPRSMRAPTASDRERRYWMADAYLAGGFNQLTLALLAGLRYRIDQPRSDNVLLDNRRLEFGVELNVNPGFTSVGGYVEWTPLQVLVVRAQTDVYAHYGTYGAIMRFDQVTPATTFRDELRDVCAGCRAGFVQRALGRVALQAQVGPVVLRNQLDVAAYVLHGDEPFYILIEHDILAARSEIFVLDEVQLLLEPYRRPDRTGLYVGALYHFARTLRAQVQRQRVGLFGEWVFRPRLGPFARPRLLGLAGYHVEDRNRGGGFIGIVCMGSEFDL